MMLQKKEVRRALLQAIATVTANYLGRFAPARVFKLAEKIAREEATDP